jgi:hypothetical protein
MQARFYDPQVGRFLSTDPVDFRDDDPFTFNRYSYGNNNPYRYVDPDGRMTLAWAEMHGQLPKGSAEQMAQGQLAGMAATAGTAAVAASAVAGPQVAAAARASPAVQQAAGAVAALSSKAGAALASAKVAVDIRVSQAVNAVANTVANAVQGVGNAIAKVGNQVMSSPVGTNPAVQQNAVDFASSLTPGTPPAPTPAGGAATLTSVIVGPAEETLR